MHRITFHYHVLGCTASDVARHITEMTVFLASTRFMGKIHFLFFIDFDSSLVDISPRSTTEFEFGIMIACLDDCDPRLSLTFDWSGR